MMTMGIITARKRDNITQTTQAMASNVETMGFANPPDSEWKDCNRKWQCGTSGWINGWESWITELHNKGRSVVGPKTLAFASSANICSISLLSNLVWQKKRIFPSLLWVTGNTNYLTRLQKLYTIGPWHRGPSKYPAASEDPVELYCNLPLWLKLLLVVN